LSPAVDKESASITDEDVITASQLELEALQGIYLLGPLRT
jgi:hypothetical protein